MLGKLLLSSLMHHTRMIVPGGGIAVLIAWSSSTLPHQLLLVVLKIDVMDCCSLHLFLLLPRLQLRVWSSLEAFKLIVYYPSQLQFCLGSWVIEQTLQLELISTNKMKPAATLKYYLLSLSLLCYLFLLLYLFSELVALFDLGHSHLIDIGTEAY